MRFIFIDKNEYELGVIKDILSSYNVHYKVRTDRECGFFGSSCTYNIEIDVTPEFYEYLCKEIDNKLAPVELLEDCYDLPDAVKPVKVKRKTRRSKTKVDNRDRYLPGLPEFLERMFNEHINEHVNNPEDKELVNFDQLSKQEQEMLKERLPEHILRSNDCVITRTQWGLQVFVGREDD